MGQSEEMMMKMEVNTCSEEHFFGRGRYISRLIDSGEELAEAHILSFEDPEDMLRLLTETRVKLFMAVKEMPGSITDVAARLHRDRSAVKRDVDVLAEAGMVTVTSVKFPGHGLKKEVRAVADRLVLQSELG